MPNISKMWTTASVPLPLGFSAQDLEQPNITGASASFCMHLREHHCASPAVPLPSEDDVMNEFLARDLAHPKMWTVTEHGGRFVRRTGKEWGRTRCSPRDSGRTTDFA
ncbi:hypothetical protein L227DRAFT_303994 [Lentinus tigrinus ALCF2SS1-6]|uniref:Uncharacterized protein n=1 Tax=Lentinus tigrinus ALCF2SS1-6 TaxID=1328759 RepID=A0A5C2RX61_9APHY|nr:hypothetical protein L227DRAFT_303994 [Lentinus tigrinus ALCF2SS1-6]